MKNIINFHIMKIKQSRKNKWASSTKTGVAELGGPGGPWPPPPKKFEWEGQGMFWPPPPPKILTTGPPKMGASGQNLCQIASEHPEVCKIFKIIRLRRASKGRTYFSGDLRL